MGILDQFQQPQPLPANPAQAMPPATPQRPFTGFGGPQGMSQLGNLYAAMAAGAKDPSQVGGQFVNAIQQQQRLNAVNQQQQRENSPLALYARLYGNVNPHDFTKESMAAFHDNLVKNQALDFNLLQRRETMTTKEQGYLNDAITATQKAESDLGRMNDLANRFTEQARQGVLAGKVAGGINEWLKGMLGTEDAVSQLRTEFEQLRISSVVQNLPPGVASDKDVALVLKGWPGSVSNPAYIAAFLRGMQKIKAVDRAFNAHAAAFIGTNRTQVGQLQDWDKNKQWMAEDALRRFGGGYWNPGEDVTPEQAAEMRWQKISPTPAATPAPAPAAAPTPAAAPRTQPMRTPQGGDAPLQDIVDMYLKGG